MMGYEKYIGRSVVMIYQDGKGVITKRTVDVRSVTDTHLLGRCRMANSPRVFRLSGVLAIQPEVRAI